jgi:hypothetical protein
MGVHKRDIILTGVCGGSTYMCLQFSVYLWVRLPGFRASLNGMYWSLTIHVCGIVSTVTIWRYGRLLYLTHLLALCIFVTKVIYY